MPPSLQSFTARRTSARVHQAGVCAVLPARRLGRICTRASNPTQNDLRGSGRASILPRPLSTANLLAKQLMMIPANSRIVRLAASISSMNFRCPRATVMGAPRLLRIACKLELSCLTGYCAVWYRPGKSPPIVVFLPLHRVVTRAVVRWHHVLTY